MSCTRSMSDGVEHALGLGEQLVRAARARSRAAAWAYGSSGETSISAAFAIAGEVNQSPQDPGGFPRAGRRCRSAAGGRARAAAAPSASSPAGSSRTRCCLEVVARGHLRGRTPLEHGQRPVQRRARPAPARPAGAARPRCRRPPRRRRPAAGRCRPARARRARGPPASSSSVGGSEPRKRSASIARAERQRGRPLHAAGQRAGGDLRRAAAHVDHGRPAPRAASPSVRVAPRNASRASSVPSSTATSIAAVAADGRAELDARWPPGG